MATEQQTENEMLVDAVRGTEQEILDAAFEREAQEAQPGEQPPAEGQEPGAEQPGERPRDEQGRFVSADQAGEQPGEGQGEQAEGEQPNAGEQQGQQEDRVPSWRLREIAEERRQAIAENERLRADLARLQAIQQQQRPQQQQQEEFIDPLVDPAGFARQERAMVEERFRRMELNTSLALAHTRHGEQFEQAYSALVQQGQSGNSRLVQQLVSQPNPGEAIVDWFRRENVMREVGGDPAKYRETLEANLLKDPKFLARAAEAIRGGGKAPAQGAQPGQPGTPKNVFELPPSLSRAAGSSPQGDPIDNDDSEGSVFSYATR